MGCSMTKEDGRDADLIDSHRESEESTNRRAFGDGGSASSNDSETCHRLQLLVVELLRKNEELRMEVANLYASQRADP